MHIAATMLYPSRSGELAEGAGLPPEGAAGEFAGLLALALPPAVEEPDDVSAATGPDAAVSEIVGIGLAAISLALPPVIEPHGAALPQTGKDLPPIAGPAPSAPLPDGATAVLLAVPPMPDGAHLPAADPPSAPSADAGEPAELPQAKPQMLPPLPAELEARRAAAPATIASVFVQQLANGRAADEPRSARGTGASERRDPASAIRSEATASTGPAAVPAPAATREAASHTLAALTAAQPEAVPRPAEPAMPLAVDGSAQTRVAAAGSPAAAEPRAALEMDMAALVDRLVEGRVQARAERSVVDLPHPDFGRVTLALSLQADDRLGIDLPGAPGELRQSVSQALAAPTRSEAAAGATAEHGASSDRSAADARSGRGEADAGGREQPRQQAQPGSATTLHSAAKQDGTSRRGVLA